MSSTNLKAQYYVSIMPAFYTSAGTTGERLTGDIEFGKQWKSISVGVEMGKINFAKQSKKDTSIYSEARVNLNVFEQNRLTNTLSMGIGYVFNAQANLMVEASTGIEYTIDERNHMNLFFGTYFFSGRRYAYNNNFFGLSLVRYFKKNNLGAK